MTDVFVIIVKISTNFTVYKPVEDVVRSLLIGT